MRIEKTLLLSCMAFCVHVASVRAQREAAQPSAYPLDGDIEGTHDPSIIKEGNIWYLFAP